MREDGDALTKEEGGGRDQAQAQEEGGERPEQGHLEREASGQGGRERGGELVEARLDSS